MTTATAWLRVSDRRLAWIRDVVLALSAAYLLALSAQVRVALPFSPVPVTGQTLVVLLIGALLGRRRAALSMGGYLAAGALGLPFFAAGALGGPTGGYLLGFVAAIYVVAALMARGWGRRPLTLVAALFAGNGMIYLLGLAWLARFVGPRAVLPLGFYPFVVGDLAKMFCAAGIVLAWRQFSTRGH